MIVSKSLRTIGAWGASHQTLLIVALAIIICCAAVIGWRYIYLDRQASTIQPSVINQAASSIDGGLLNTIYPSTTDVQVQTSLNGVSDAKPVVKINNQPVSLPANNEIHKVIQDSGGTSVVDISVQSNTSGNTSSSSSTSVQLNSASESSIETGQQP